MLKQIGFEKHLTKKHQDLDLFLWVLLFLWQAPLKNWV